MYVVNFSKKTYHQWYNMRRNRFFFALTQKEIDAIRDFHSKNGYIWTFCDEKGVHLRGTILSFRIDDSVKCDAPKKRAVFMELVPRSKSREWR